MFLLKVFKPVNSHKYFAAPIKVNRSPKEPDENNEAYEDRGYPSKYSGKSMLRFLLYIT